MASHLPTEDPQRREHPDPQESLNPVPFIILGMMVMLFAWAVYYLLAAHPDSPPALGDKRTLSVLTAIPVKATNGEEIFSANCVPCHQAAGTGIPGVFPPLAGSEWVLGKDTVLAQIILHGINGSISVKGTTYNGAMPTFKDRFNDDEIAAVATYIRSHWGNTMAPVTSVTVQTQRAATRDRTEPWKGGNELAQLK